MKICRSRYSPALVAIAAACCHPLAVADDVISEVVVTSLRQAQPSSAHDGNVTRLTREAIQQVRHHHAHELLSRVAGTWISRGSGQEHLTALRSPVLTGAGSCGAFLLLENGIPVRPSGFCNVNQLIEINTEQAAGIEVIRGPGSAVFGSNALHGVIDVAQPEPGVRRREASLEVGANEFGRLMFDTSIGAGNRVNLGALLARDGGFRDDAGYRQGKLRLSARHDVAGGTLRSSFAASMLDQETAGFIIGQDAYRDDDLRRSNANPEAYRQAHSQRLTAHWQRQNRGWQVDLRPYLRRSDMEFLQHFLPGQPLEENGHSSAGWLAAVSHATDARLLIVGLDAEWADVWLRETQSGPTVGSDFLVETRPAGAHYDFEVTSIAAAPFVQWRWRPQPRWQLGAGLRFESIRYDYDNRMLVGNTRDDGSACGFGGCLYSRPADRTDRFSNLAPNAGLQFKLDDRSALFAFYSEGFRAPQMTELYRLQNGQQVADLDSERIASLEVGLRFERRLLRVEAALYSMRKKNSVFRDADGFNVSAGRSEHRGVELQLGWQPRDDWNLNLSASYARHRYAFDRIASLGEQFLSGRDVDTAPRWLASAELMHAPRDGLSAGLQVTYLGAYFLDAENAFEYPGHTLGNVFLRWQSGASWQWFLRINNVFDRRYADRADFAFGNFRYFPGRERELFVELRYSGRSD